MKHSYFFTGILFFLTACALPRTERIPDSFISESELHAVSSYREGLYYYNLGRYQDAEKHFFKALSEEPQSRTIRVNLVLSLTENGDIDLARTILDTISAKSELDADYVRLQTRLLEREAKYDEAIALLSGWLEKNREVLESAAPEEKKESAILKAELAGILFRLGREIEATCLINELLEIPAFQQLYFPEYVRYTLASGRYRHVSDVFASLPKEAKLQHDMRLLYYQAIAHIGSGEYQLAQSAISTALVLETPSPAIYQGVLFVRNYLASRKLENEQGDDVQEKAVPLTFGGSPLASPEAFLWPQELLEYAHSVEEAFEDDNE